MTRRMFLAALAASLIVTPDDSDGDEVPPI